MFIAGYQYSMQSFDQICILTEQSTSTGTQNVRQKYMIMILSFEIAQMPKGKDPPILGIFLSFISLIPCQKNLRTKLQVWELCEGEVLMDGRGAIAGWNWKGRKPPLVVRELSKTPNYCVS